MTPNTKMVRTADPTSIQCHRRVRCADRYEAEKNEQAAEIRAQYQAAYGAAPGIGEEFSGWEDQGAWPKPSGDR